MSTTTLKDDGVILGLNVHAKEYYGASSYLASAVIVAVHDQNDDPMIEDYGFEILGGTTAEIRIARFEVIFCHNFRLGNSLYLFVCRFVSLPIRQH